MQADNDEFKNAPFDPNDFDEPPGRWIWVLLAMMTLAIVGAGELIRRWPQYD